MDNQEDPYDPKPSLFPLFSVAGDGAATSASTAPATTSVPQWLCNPSFTSDLSLINDAVSSLPRALNVEEEEDEQKEAKQQQQSYELIEEEEEEDEEDSYSDGERNERKKKKKKSYKKNKKRKMSKEMGDSKSIHAKDYFFDSHPDPDNLAYGSLYRMDVPRYKLHNSERLSAFLSQGLYCWTQRASTFNKDSDIDSFDTKLKSSGRYWSPNNAALEHHNNLKRLRLFAPKDSEDPLPADFIPLLDDQSLQLGDGSSVSNNSVIEESWEDEVLRKTREFNKLTREHPHDEKVWLAFAEFQDKVASSQRQKGVRLQTLEKKISILEKASELNPDNEQILLCLMKAYQKRDNTDVLIGRWENLLMQHSGSYMMWREFLHVVQGEFSRFKVSDMRKIYAHAVQALFATCSKQFRQCCTYGGIVCLCDVISSTISSELMMQVEPDSVQNNYPWLIHQTSKPPDCAMIQLELGLVDIFLSLCRFEWQTGHQELATALFQAQIEFSLFCPHLSLNEHSKQRLFKHFWDSGAARVGEEGALCWSVWLEKEEENRQRVMKEEGSDKDDEGGWTGWSEPLSKSKETSTNLENIADNDVMAKEFDEEIENEDVKQEDDTEALLKQLGIDVDPGANAEVKDAFTWARWSEEESLRDSNQWMPIHAKSGLSLSLSLSLYTRAHTRIHGILKLITY
ncbi:Tetratricopeptide-like helical [Corchorus capsularis]|uniref:Tetratricopeptide-like helical n=1 Tax=Corchorus capsularis TaxID=210143 RepID=A0A1R3IVN7_COCAP|nr:Tetratricopeptide-like helical [Corchorus capsularis]